MPAEGTLLSCTSPKHTDLHSGEFRSQRQKGTQQKLEVLSARTSLEPYNLRSVAKALLRDRLHIHNSQSTGNKPRKTEFHFRKTTASVIYPPNALIPKISSVPLNSHKHLEVEVGTLLHEQFFEISRGQNSDILRSGCDKHVQQIEMCRVLPSASVRTVRQTCK